LLSAGAELSRGQAAPSFRLVFLAGEPMAEETRLLLARWLERQMHLAEGSVQLAHVAAVHRLELDPRGGFTASDRARLGEIGGQLVRYPQLRAQVDLPAKGGERSVKSVLARLLEEIPLLGDPSRCTIQENPEEARSLILTLRPSAPQAPSTP
jgi:hypothetical protein